MKFSSSSDRTPLMDVALGKAPADLVLLNARLVNVLTREILPSDIAIKNGRVAAVLPAGTSAWQALVSTDLQGKFVTPGFIDPHVHIESSMVTVREFSRAVVPCGVTMVAADPHELANVLGVRGIRAMMDEAQTVPLRTLLRVPGRIPAVPDEIETSGARIDLDATEAMLDWPETVCLAGDINPGLVLKQDREQLLKSDAAMARSMTVSGQSPGLSGAPLCAYVAAGPEDSHVALNVEEVLENQRLGLRSVLTIRPGRRLDRQHFRQLGELIKNNRLETRFLQFCTDDVFPHLLEDEGHIDHRVRMAIEEGFDPMTAIQMATLNAAEGLRIDRDFGSISPGKHADLLVMSDLDRIKIDSVMIAGQWVCRDGTYLAEGEPYVYPEWARSTMRTTRRFSRNDMRIQAGRQARSSLVRTLHTVVPKEAKDITLPVVDGAIQPSPELGVSSLVVIDRHTPQGRMAKGFVSGIHLKRGAIATTISHDAHNLMVIGASHDDMALAANRAIEIGGGYVLVADQKILYECALPVAGLMSDKPFPEVAEMARQVEKILIGTLGCPPLSQILMRLTHLSLPNIPNFGFTNIGMISTKSMEPVDSVLELLDEDGRALLDDDETSAEGRPLQSFRQQHPACG